jgi:hypothetical protein
MRYMYLDEFEFMSFHFFIIDMTFTPQELIIHKCLMQKILQLSPNNSIVIKFEVIFEKKYISVVFGNRKSLVKIIPKSVRKLSLFSRPWLRTTTKLLNCLLIFFRKNIRIFSEIYAEFEDVYKIMIL